MQIQFLISGSDPDNDHLVFSADTLPAGATFDAATRSFSWTPNDGQMGFYRVTFRVSDDGNPSLTDIETITVHVGKNWPPVLASIPDEVVDECSLMSFTVSAFDTEREPLTFSTGTLPEGVSFHPGTRTFSWRPVKNQVGKSRDRLLRHGQRVSAVGVTLKWSGSPS